MALGHNGLMEYVFVARDYIVTSVVDPVGFEYLRQIRNHTCDSSMSVQKDFVKKSFVQLVITVQQNLFV